MVLPALRRTSCRPPGEIGALRPLLVQPRRRRAGDGLLHAATSTRMLSEADAGFEKMLVDAGIRLFKFWLDIGREMQLKRFHERRHDPLKIWKLSPIDYAADGHVGRLRARDEMFLASQTPEAPWTVVRSNDKSGRGSTSSGTCCPTSPIPARTRRRSAGHRSDDPRRPRAGAPWLSASPAPTGCRSHTDPTSDE